MPVPLQNCFSFLTKYLCCAEHQPLTLTTRQNSGGINAPSHSSSYTLVNRARALLGQTASMSPEIQIRLRTMGGTTGNEPLGTVNLYSEDITPSSGYFGANNHISLNEFMRRVKQKIPIKPEDNLRYPIFGPELILVHGMIPIKTEKQFEEFLEEVRLHLKRTGEEFHSPPNSMNRSASSSPSSTQRDGSEVIIECNLYFLPGIEANTARFVQQLIDGGHNFSKGVRARAMEKIGIDEWQENAIDHLNVKDGIKLSFERIVKNAEEGRRIIKDRFDPDGMLRITDEDDPQRILRTLMNLNPGVGRDYYRFKVSFEDLPQNRMSSFISKRNSNKFIIKLITGGRFLGDDVFGGQPEPMWQEAARQWVIALYEKIGGDVRWKTDYQDAARISDEWKMERSIEERLNIMTDIIKINVFIEVELLEDVGGLGWSFVPTQRWDVQLIGGPAPNERYYYYMAFGVRIKGDGHDMHM